MNEITGIYIHPRICYLSRNVRGYLDAWYTISTVLMLAYTDRCSAGVEKSLIWMVGPMVGVYRLNQFRCINPD